MMTALYSYKGAYPYPLPKDMSKYDIQDFYLAGEKPELTAGQILEWDHTAWVVRAANEAENQIQWAAVRVKRDSLLSTSDVYVVRAYEKGEPVPQETVDYRQALRDVTEQPNPFAIAWPTTPTNPF